MAPFDLYVPFRVGSARRCEKVHSGVVVAGLAGSRRWHVAIPLALRGVIAFVDRALDPRTATRNARHAAADLAEQLRQRRDVERSLRQHDRATGTPRASR